jgi:hypothetical protein
VNILPAYSGPCAKCPKCNNGQADTEWQPSDNELTPYGREATEDARMSV